MKIKTTKEIKRQNDYAGKRWVEVSDVTCELVRIANELGESEEKTIDEEEVEDTKEKKDWGEIKQMLRNLNQSKEFFSKRMDKFTEKITQITKEVNEIRTDINSLFDYHKSTDERLRILESERDKLKELKEQHLPTT